MIGRGKGSARARSSPLLPVTRRSLGIRPTGDRTTLYTVCVCVHARALDGAVGAMVVVAVVARAAWWSDG